MAKEALSKKDILGASHLIRTLMGEIVGLHHLEQKFSELYSLIIRAGGEELKDDFMGAVRQDS